MCSGITEDMTEIVDSVSTRLWTLTVIFYHLDVVRGKEQNQVLSDYSNNTTLTEKDKHNF